MTDYTKLIERMRTDSAFDFTTLGNEAADAIEALQAEVNAASSAYELANKRADAMEAERDQLQSQLDAMGKGEQAAFEYWLESVHPSGDATEVKQKWEASAAFRDWHNAAPKALAPLTDEQIYNVFAATVEDAEPFSELVVDPIWAEVVEITRAIEAAHGIGCTP